MSTMERLQDSAIVFAAGYVATKAMEQIGMKTYRWEPEGDRQREEQVRPGPPFVVAADNLSKRILGLQLGEDALHRAGMALHQLSGVAWAPVYMWLRRVAGFGPIAAGLATGASQSLLLDEIVTPAIGASAPNRDYPLTTHLRGLVGHLGYGLAIAGVVEAGWQAVGRRP